MKNYFDICRKQLSEIEARNKEAPPGDNSAKVRWIVDRIRGMIIQAEVRAEQGKGVIENEKRIQEAFDTLEQFNT